MTSAPVPLATAALVAGLLLSGCVQFSADGGFGAVADAAHDRVGHAVRWPRSADERAKTAAEVAALVAQPLSAEDAVQVALLNNHGLQAAFQELGVSEADLVQAGRLPNPGFTLRHASGGGLVDIEATLTVNVVSLLTAPYRVGIERRRFEQRQQALVGEVVRLADATRTAYYTALAARDSLQYAWQVKDAAQTGGELAHRMLSAGNWNQLDSARQQIFYMQALQQLALAQEADAAARAELERLLGVADAAGPLRLAEHLPDLPQVLIDLPESPATQLQDRIDLKVRRLQVEELRRRLNLRHSTRFIDVLDAGPTRVRNGTRQDPVEWGYELDFEIPIFDSGAARVRRAEAAYGAAVEEFAQATVDARAEILTARARYRATYEMAVREHDDILRTHSLIAAQDLLRFNASLISVFELLADARERISSANDYIARLRDFWVAKSHLDSARLVGATW